MTGAQFIHLATKKLMGVTSFKEYFFDYIRTAFTDMVAAVFNKDGTFGDLALEISESGSLLSIDDGTGTDGAGHFMEITATEKDVPWPRDGEYSVGLKYAERPVGIQINPRTGRPEYQNWQEAIGERGEPDEVVDMSGTHLRITVDSLGESAVTMAGRTALVWLATPAPGATTEGIAIEECIVVFDAGTNYIDTVGLLGNTTADIDTLHYQVLILGPTIRSDDLEAVAGYWFIGWVDYSGSFVFDGGDQRLIVKSLSDLVDHLVYSNVRNTFTETQTIDMTDAVTLDEALVIDGGPSASTALHINAGTGATTAGAINAFASGADAIAIAGHGGNTGIKGEGTGHGGDFAGGGAGVIAYGNAEGGDGGHFHGSDDGTDPADGLEATGGNAGPGLKATGGYDGGDGIIAKGGATVGGCGGIFEARAGNTNGLETTGYGSGNGLNATAGASGNGVRATGPTGVLGVGTGTGARGGSFSGNGTFEALSVQQNGTGPAVKLTNSGAQGDLELHYRSAHPGSAANAQIWWHDTDGLCFMVGGVAYKITGVTAI